MDPNQPSSPPQPDPNTVPVPPPYQPPTAPPVPDLSLPPNPVAPPPIPPATPTGMPPVMQTAPVQQPFVVSPVIPSVQPSVPQAPEIPPVPVMPVTPSTPTVVPPSIPTEPLPALAAELAKSSGDTVIPGMAAQPPNVQSIPIPGSNGIPSQPSSVGPELKQADILPPSGPPGMVMPPEAHKNTGMLPYVLGFVVLLVLVFAGSYYYFFVLTAPPVTDVPDSTTAIPQLENPRTPTRTVSPEPSPVVAEPTLTETDTVSDIESDLNATDIEDIDTDFTDVTNDLNSL